MAFRVVIAAVARAGAMLVTPVPRVQAQTASIGDGEIGRADAPRLRQFGSGVLRLTDFTTGFAPESARAASLTADFMEVTSYFADHPDPAKLDAIVDNIELLGARHWPVTRDSGMGAIAEAISTLSEDLSAKAAFVAALAVVDEEAAPLIVVTLSTFRDSVEVMGLAVKADPALFTSAEHPAYAFSSASSPTALALPPGVYCVFIRDVNRVLLTSKRVTIGTLSVGTEAIRVQVPQP